jgi:hypothetical protein
MEDRKTLLSDFAVTVKETGPLNISSCEELKDIISHQFGFRKQEFYVYCSSPDPFVIIFSERHARDVVFAAGSVIDGALELHFNAWDLDEFGDRVMLPYHIKLCLEGIPHHAWSQEIVDKILCEEAVIHHVE